jgi:hypothetical protein
VNVYVGPIEHDPQMCLPDRCPGDWGCWCADCERGNHPPVEAPEQADPLTAAKAADWTESELRFAHGDR